MKQIFKHPIFKSSLLISLIAISTACSTSLPSIKLDKQMPTARLYFTDGQIGSIEDYKGQDLLLIFWASGCSHSFNALKEISEWKNTDVKSKKYQVVDVNIDKNENEKKVQELIKRLGRTQLKHSYSGNDIYDEAYVAFDVSVLPTIFRIDRSGKVVAVGSSLSAVLP